MTNIVQDMSPAMALALAASFGSAAQWQTEFNALAPTGDSAAWKVLSFQPSLGSLINHTATGSDLTATGRVPVLVRETSDQTPLAWDAVYARYQHAVHDASDAFGVAPDATGHAIVLDVRRAGVFEQAKTMLPGAQWKDPAAVALWGAELPCDQEVLVYCVYGHEVGRSTAMRLCAMGVNARFLPGGIDAWQTAGKPVQAK